MHVVRRPPCFTSMFSEERCSEEICKYFHRCSAFGRNSDQFTARTFNDERFAEIFAADASAQTRSITNISVTDDLKLEMSRARSTARCESNFVRVAAEHGFQIFTKSTTVNHVRVTSTDMPYHGANFHGRGLKIRLCGLTVSTGALNAVEIYVKKREKFFRKMSKTYSKMSGQPIWTLNRSHVCHS